MDTPSETTTREPETDGARSRRRWIPPALILAGAAVAWILIWSAEGMRQFKVIQTVATALLAGFLLLLWLAFGSGLAWRTRGVVLGGAAALAVLAGVCFKIEGVTGDFIPTIGWRFAPPPDRTLARERASASAEPTPLEGLGAWPRFLGADFDLKAPAPLASEDWHQIELREVWRRPVGAAWSGFAIARGRALTQEQRGERELVTCYDAATGELLWTHAAATRYETTLGGIGPRATPTVDEDRVFTLGANGALHCLRLETGEQVWSADIAADAGARVPEWGFAGSPLVLDGRVFVSAGGSSGKSMLVYDAATGELLASGGDDRAGYSSPVPAEIHGAVQVLILNHHSVAAHDSKTGALLWSAPWPGKYPKVAQPVPIGGNRVFVSSGYGVGAALFEIERDAGGAFSAKQLWKNLRMKAKFSNLVLKDGFLYGLDDGILACLDAATGKRRWKGGRYGHGQMILAGDVLVVQSEDGDVVLVAATPEAHRPLKRVEVFDVKTWNSPALAGRYLFVRNDREAACLTWDAAGGRD